MFLCATTSTSIMEDRPGYGEHTFRELRPDAELVPYEPDYDREWEFCGSAVGEGRIFWFWRTEVKPK